jgi:hypothetical protein
MKIGHLKGYQMSDGCEAMLWVNEVWCRCWKQPTESHHMLTRARGGAILDEIGETYHKINLCREHHAWSDGGQAYEAGLLIDGYVTKENGKVVYQGTNHYLRRQYGQS